MGMTGRLHRVYVFLLATSRNMSRTDTTVTTPQLWEVLSLLLTFEHHKSFVGIMHFPWDISGLFGLGCSRSGHRVLLGSGAVTGRAPHVLVLESPHDEPRSLVGAAANLTVSYCEAGFVYQWKCLIIICVWGWGGVGPHHKTDPYVLWNWL